MAGGDRAGAADVEDLLTVSTNLWREDAGTHDPTVMNTDWPAQHGRESFAALVEDPDRVGVLADGYVAGAGPTAAVLADARLLGRAGLGLPPLLSGLLELLPPEDLASCLAGLEAEGDRLPVATV